MADTAKKGRGLGKLKYYCDACKRQCGDALGYQRHCESDAHLAMMQHFRENSQQILEDNSQQFERDFLYLLQRRGTQKVEANVIYQEFISNRHHIHMNVTKWATLTDFARYLGQTDKCLVEFIEGRGYFLTYVEKDQKKIDALRRAKAVRQVLNDQSSRLEDMVRFQVEQQQRSSQQHHPVAGLTALAHHEPPHSDQQPHPIEAPTQIKVQSTSHARQPEKRKATTSIFDLADASDDDSEDDVSGADHGHHQQQQQQQQEQQDMHAVDIHPNMAPASPKATPLQPTISNAHAALGGIGVGVEPSLSKPLETNRDINDAQRIVEHSQHSRGAAPSPTHQWCVACPAAVDFPDDAPWLREGLQVKILQEDLNDGMYYGRRGVVKALYAYIDDRLLKYVPSAAVCHALLQGKHLDHAQQSQQQQQQSDSCREFNHCFPISIDFDKEECYDYRFIAVADVDVELPSTDGVGEPSFRTLRLPQEEMETVIPRSRSATSIAPSLAVIQGKYSPTSLCHRAPPFAAFAQQSLSGHHDDLLLYDNPPEVEFVRRTSDEVVVRLTGPLYKLFDEWLQQHADASSPSSQPLLYQQEVSVQFDDVCLLNT